MKHLFTLIAILTIGGLHAQNNIISTNPEAEQILLGKYNPADYHSSLTPTSHTQIAMGLQADISPDSLKKSILKLATFKNRNSGADTLSPVTGIGAARRWTYGEFERQSATGTNKTVPSYLQWNEMICNQQQHRNIFTVLPGTDTVDKSIVIIEGHIDSRCVGLCDTACVAEGVEDNATGTALIMELARVMRNYNFKNTIVFMAVIGEEQGLLGARAFAAYCKQKGIKIKAVLNNDVIGGIICGKTSSAPSCPGLNDIDSTQVRLFSYGIYYSNHKNLCRYIKLQYEEELKQFVKVPMLISIMTDEDRTGRGGDHIPFRENNYTAMRFTSANEHGDASNGTGYTDRQHTSNDILGVDTDNDTKIDSFFVDFNYLARNAAINGNAAGMAAIGPKMPIFSLSKSIDNKMKVKITSSINYPRYRIAIKTTSNDWDTLWYTTNLIDSFAVETNKSLFVSVASVDENNIESLFATEQRINIAVGIEEYGYHHTGIELLPNKPNPFDEATSIAFIVHKDLQYKEAYIRITDLNGREIQKMPTELKPGINELIYNHGYNATGTYLYQLVIDGKAIATRRMVFTAN